MATVGNTSGMAPSIEQTVEQFKRSVADARRGFHKDPKLAEDFLIRAGIAQKNEKTGKIDLVDSLRPTK